MYSRRLYTAFIVIMLISTTCIGQQFYRSEGLELFNQGHFLSAIDAMKNWSEDFRSEKGIAYYYIGECYYNLGLVSQSRQTSISHFTEALRFLELALKQVDLETLYIDKIVHTQYKIGWCHFRLAEINKEQDHFEKAAFTFQKLASENHDSLSVYAAYLLGESYLRNAQHQQYLLHLSLNEGEIANINQTIYHLLSQAEIAYQAIQALDQNRPFLRACAMYRFQDVQILFGKLFSLMESELARSFPVNNDKLTPFLIARQYFEKVQYSQVLHRLNQKERASFYPAVYYGEMVKQLNLYLISEGMEYRQTFNQCLDSLRWGEYQNEKLLFKGMADQKSKIDSDYFEQLIHPVRSPYARSAHIYPEAWYWLGLTQFIGGDHESRSQFEKFLNAVDKPFADPRLSFLIEDATYRVFQLQFDQHADKRSQLQKIRKSLAGFHPQYEIIQQKRDQLLRLTRVGLGEDIWTEILQATTVDDKLSDAFFLIRQMLVRASSVVGKERVPYIRYLDRLLNITRDRREIETTFYRGMAEFLRAEIQESAQNKRKFYIDAADILNTSLDKYQQEGLYIQARSYFAAAKHEEKLEQREQTYGRAKPIFIKLINEANSLRSLYYLAEIFRLQGNHLAARACYRVVMQKTKDKKDGGFWYENAQAGISSCQSQGDISVLGDIRITSVQFPDFFLVVDGNPISLEKFADPAYVRNQYWEEALEMLLKFGPPKRDIYPSMFPVANSSFLTYSFPGLMANIRERTGAVYSGLRLQILYPEGIQDATVRLDDIPLMANAQGQYQKTPVVLNEKIKIQVDAPLCYPYIHKHTFIQPGIEKIIVPMVQQLSFDASDEILEEDIQVYRFDDRLDNNLILLSSINPLSLSTSLIQDFESDVSYRDFCYSRFHNSYFASHASKSVLTFYQGNGISMKRSDFELLFPNYDEKIGSVEGITVDLNGNIYIVDWQKHRIILFNDAGTYQKEIGSFGKNSEKDVGKLIHFTYPTRISLGEDRNGIEVDGLRVYRDPILFVTDRYGIHIVSHDGIYWDTLDLNIKRSEEISAISAKGYGNNIHLYVGLKNDKKIKRFLVRQE